MNFTGETGTAESRAFPPDYGRRKLFADLAQARLDQIPLLHNGENPRRASMEALAGMLSAQGEIRAEAPYMRIMLTLAYCKYRDEQLYTGIGVDYMVLDRVSSTAYTELNELEELMKRSRENGRPLPEPWHTATTDLAYLENGYTTLPEDAPTEAVTPSDTSI